ncbi:ester cyclase [Rhizobium ruizarguesonis]
MAQENKDLMVQYMEEVWNQGNLAAIPNYIHSQFAPSTARVAAFGTGPTVIEGLVKAFRSAMPNLRYAIHDVIGEADKVVIRVTAEGDHTAEVFGHTPAATRANQRPINGIIIARFKDGKIIEAWNQFDTISGQT